MIRPQSRFQRSGTGYPCPGWERNEKEERKGAPDILTQDGRETNEQGERRTRETKNRLPQELYGSRKNLSAIQVAVNRRMIIDNIKLKRKGGAIAGVDAAQCYDRIVHSLAILLCQREGSPIEPLIMMFGTIQSMCFFIRTTFGDSTGSYGGI